MGGVPHCGSTQRPLGSTMTSSVAIALSATDHSIRSVVVFRKRAEVTRTFPVELEAGNNEVEIKHLPSSLDAQSIRIQGMGRSVTVLDVVHKPPTTASNFGFGAAKKPKENEVLRILKLNKTELEGERKVLDHQAELIVNYSRTLSAEHISPENFLAFMERFVEEGRKNLQAITDKNKEIHEINELIKKEEETPPTQDDQADKRRASVTVVIHAQNSVKAEITLIYVVPDASWNPTYDLRGITDESTSLPSNNITLHYRASIIQATGEDWKNTALTLSTAQPEFGSTIPILLGSKIKTIEGGGFQWGQTQSRGLFGPPNTSNNDNNTLFGQQKGGFGGFGQTAQPSVGFGAFSAAAQPTSAFGGGLFGQPGGPAPQTTGFPAAGTSLFGSAFGTAVPQVPLQFSQQQQQVVQQQQQQQYQQARQQQQQQQAQQQQQQARQQQPEAQPAATTSTQPIPEVDNADENSANAVAFEDEFVALESPSTSNALEDGEDALQPFDYATATAASTSVAATYKIEGKTTIPSDSSTHKVAISRVTSLEANISLITVPKQKRAAYIQAWIKNTTDDPLLPGDAAIFYDETYVGSTRISHVPPKGGFLCSFGLDHSVRVLFHQTQEKLPTSTYKFAQNSDKVRCKRKVTIINDRRTSIPELIVRDTVPSATAPFQVILESPEGLAKESTLKSIDVDKENGITASWMFGQDGKMEWRLKDVKKGESRNLELIYIVESPAGTKWKQE